MNSFWRKDAGRPLKSFWVVREKQVSQHLSYMETNFFFNDKNELIYRTETDLQILETNLWSLKGECEEQE